MCAVMLRKSNTISLNADVDPAEIDHTCMHDISMDEKLHETWYYVRFTEQHTANRNSSGYIYI